MHLSQAFLWDITDNPADDTPRLIYADWLEEHGQPERAEFIRLQCCRARLSADDSEQSVLAARESALLACHESDWLATLPSLEDVTWVELHRGFVEEVCVESAEAFLEHAPALFRAAPVRRVQIRRIDPSSARDLAGSPYLGRLIELNLGNGTGLCGRCVRSLAGSRQLEFLEALLLHYNDLGDEAVAHLADSPQLGELRELYLSGTNVSDDGAAAVGSLGSMPQLRDLDLRDNQIGDDGARALAFNLGLEQVSTLWLVNNRIGEAGAEALAWTERLPGLAHLYLNYNPIGDAGAEAFAASPHRGQLIELDLRHCRIGEAGGRALAGSSYLEQVRLLWLSGNWLGTESLTLLRRRFGARLRI
jgi:uncharacterized protein (TIGR02996 family)